MMDSSPVDPLPQACGPIAASRNRRRPRRLRTQLPQITADERRQAAEAGKPHQGGPRAYGYAPDRITIIDAEAEVIRECAKRVLAGETLSRVANDLNGRKIVTAEFDVTGRVLRVAPNDHVWREPTLPARERA